MCSGVKILIPTRITVIMVPSSTQPNSGVTVTTNVYFITKDTDSCFSHVSTVMLLVTLSVKSFPVTANLQGSLRANQRLPRVTTQWGAAVLPISDQRVQGVCLLFDDNELDLLVDLHTEADLGEGCVPVRGKFGLLWVKPSPPSVKFKGFFVAPETGVVVKRLLW